MLRMRRVPGVLLLPAVLLAATALSLHAPRLVRAWLAAHDVLLGVVLGVGVLLATQFGRSRAALAMCSLAFAGLLLRTLGPESGSRLALALPLALLGFAFLPEKPLASGAGVARLLLAALPLACAAASPQAFELGTTPAQLAAASAALCAALLMARILTAPGPLEAGFLGALVAVVLAFSSWTPPPLAPLWLATGLVALAVAVVQEGRRMAYQDELTGIPGRRAFAEHLLRLGRRYTIAMADVDHFKAFNDTHGHDAGDRVLQQVAAQLDQVGGGGRAFRCGGEEFALVFPGRSALEARPHLERLRVRIASSPVRLPARGPSVAVTVSIGFAEAQADLRSPEEVIQAADRALYEAKHAGRNRVCCSGQAAPAAVALPAGARI
jgi:diguanylate cyclase (GGDEF)-like protein